MKRTTIYLDADQELRLKLETQRQGRPMAELIREALSEYLVGTESRTAPGWGQFESGFTDTAERAEEVLAATGFGRSSAEKKPLRVPARDAKAAPRRRAKR